MKTMNERVRERIREEADKRGLTYRDIAGFLHWSVSKVGKKMTGENEISLDEFESLCFAVSLSPTEAVRDRGLEFCADMTPTELRFLEHLRKLPKPAHDGLLHFLQLSPKAESEIEARGLTKKRSGYGPTRGRL